MTDFMVGAIHRVHVPPRRVHDLLHDPHADLGHLAHQLGEAWPDALTLIFPHFDPALLPAILGEDGDGDGDGPTAAAGPSLGRLARRDSPALALLRAAINEPLLPAAGWLLPEARPAARRRIDAARARTLAPAARLPVALWIAARDLGRAVSGDGDDDDVVWDHFALHPLMDERYSPVLVAHALALAFQAGLAAFTARQVLVEQRSFRMLSSEPSPFIAWVAALWSLVLGSIVASPATIVAHTTRWVAVAVAAADMLAFGVMGPILASLHDASIATLVRAVLPSIPGYARLSELVGPSGSRRLRAALRMPDSLAIASSLRILNRRLLAPWPIVDGGNAGCQESKPCLLLELPAELRVAILQLLDARSMLAVAATCSELSAAVDAITLPKGIFRQLVDVGVESERAAKAAAVAREMMDAGESRRDAVDAGIWQALGTLPCYGLVMRDLLFVLDTAAGVINTAAETLDFDQAGNAVACLSIFARALSLPLMTPAVATALKAAPADESLDSGGTRSAVATPLVRPSTDAVFMRARAISRQ
ncbi:uncharacterized protein AMSG_05397 [Thecamonas trahens ATCC 50062]|uniref:F-box domain-containing protein n=1 Tax=Thecamonas trahens ATCC 50062 TaxID=461836 RepID=A0A0L0DBA4_THETB|nr:hypothetical protein AMSG_05397 [Thecamonas trahens ATCC 50062]KNC49396.1 hypothetical protein AMSG_05397 [Thecamonas trahens ATCC 50062]|eukprot:XP_013757820.1 hypothetical protein AMSG_05397 [Thecamonas trahens ATCC 50062]